MAQAPTFAPATAGHPFRTTLKLATGRRARSEDHDLKLFVLSFTAFFVCIYSFIS
ncbi:hypothetical protein ACLB0R_01445 [Sphingomonas sp. GlSt437]|uniref:hypothetical protein n=1 Tax=Sphingomonas sp. GlSt437 TaxID=3389970 RepID=UPI003A83C2B9